MRRINVWVLLSAAILFLGTVITAQPAAAMQGQKSLPEAFRVIGNIYWVGGEYGSYLITTPQGHILLDTGSTEMHDVIVSNVKKLGFKVDTLMQDRRTDRSTKPSCDARPDHTCG